MMSKPENTPNIPVNGSAQFSVPPGAPSAPNYIPFQQQWNMAPGPNGNNVFPAYSPWNVSQVGPQYFPPTTANQWNAQPVMVTQNIPNNVITQLSGVTACHQTFLKGKPKALGIVLIVLALCQILFAISLPFLIFTITFTSGIQFWAPVFYIIGGSFAIKAQNVQNIRLVKSSYGLNIVSSIFSFTAIILNVVDFAIMDCEYYYNCYDGGVGGYTIVSMLLIFNLLVFCVTVSIAVFGGRALDQVPSNVSPMFVIQNVLPMPPAAYPPNSSETSIQPPPYILQN